MKNQHDKMPDEIWADNNGTEKFKPHLCTQATKYIRADLCERQEVDVDMDKFFTHMALNADATQQDLGELYDCDHSTDMTHIHDHINTNQSESYQGGLIQWINRTKKHNSTQPKEEKKND